MSLNIDTQTRIKAIQHTEVSRPIISIDTSRPNYPSRQQYSRTLAYLMTLMLNTDDFLQFCTQGSTTTLSNNVTAISNSKKSLNPNSNNSNNNPFIDSLFKQKNIYNHGKDRTLISDPQLLSQNHDYILKRIGIISDDLSQIQKLFLIYYPTETIDPSLVINSVLLQIKEKIIVEKLSIKEKEDFLLKNWQKIIKAAIFGINISEFVNYEDHALKINHNIVITDIDPISQPRIPFEVFKKFSYPDKEEILKFLKEFVQTKEYEEIKNFKLETIKNSCSKRSHFFKQYQKDFSKIEQFISDQSQEYVPSNTISSNISNLEFKNDKIQKLPKVPLIQESLQQTPRAKPNLTFIKNNRLNIKTKSDSMSF